MAIEEILALIGISHAKSQHNEEIEVERELNGCEHFSVMLL